MEEVTCVKRGKEGFILMRITLILLSIIVTFLTVPSEKAIAASNIELVQQERELLSKGDVVLREVNNGKKGAKTFEAVSLIKATVSDVYQVLVKFEDYPKFMPNVSKCEVLKRTDDTAILNYTLRLPLGKVKKYRLKMTFQNEKSRATLKWKLIEWQGLKKSETIEDTTGYWLLEAYPEKAEHIIALYHVYTDPGPIPSGLGWIVDILTKNSIPDVVIKTRNRVYETYSK
jgi:hypothetical protein